MKQMLVTGGCGFIGTNTVHYFASHGWQVKVLDNMSRDGSELNKQWLLAHYPNLQFIEADVRDTLAVNAAVADVDCVIHLAGQVAVTTSVDNPRDDFEINVTGTFNVLEAIRARMTRPTLIYASTNKVYGEMIEVAVVEEDARYEYQALKNGIPEGQPLDFHSPYGCSKGAGDQYVRDYARMYGIPAVVMRQSCIYGPHQHGVADQGWLAWFMRATAAKTPVTIYGNGKQTRDVLYIDDLLAVYAMAIDRIDTVAGTVFNIGGGPFNALSVLELVAYIQQELAQPLEYGFAAARPGDQLCYISDTSRARELLGWEPQVAPAEGLLNLWNWVEHHVENYHSVV